MESVLTLQIQFISDDICTYNDGQRTDGRIKDGRTRRIYVRIDVRTDKGRYKEASSSP